MAWPRQLWTALSHVRNIPLVLRRLLKNEDDDAVQMALKLHSIVERLTAHEFLPFEIDILKAKILDYLECRQQLFERYPDIVPSPKPKHHFMR